MFYERSIPNANLYKLRVALLSAITLALIFIALVPLAAQDSSAIFQSLSVTIPKGMDRVKVDTYSFGHAIAQEYFVETKTNSDHRIASFDEGIKATGIDGRIESCSLLIDIPAGQNLSHGGFCSLALRNKKINVYICDDDMVGHFALYHSNGTPLWKPDLIEFVVANCMGG